MRTWTSCPWSDGIDEVSIECGLRFVDNEEMMAHKELDTLVVLNGVRQDNGRS